MDLKKVLKRKVVEDLMRKHNESVENQDIRTIGKLINEIVSVNEALTIHTLPNLSAKIQLFVCYFRLVSQSLNRFDGKTSAYLDLVDSVDRLCSSKPLPLTELSEVLEGLVRAIRELEEFCGISDMDGS